MAMAFDARHFRHGNEIRTIPTAASGICKPQRTVSGLYMDRRARDNDCVEYDPIIMHIHVLRQHKITPARRVGYILDVAQPTQPTEMGRQGRV